MKKVIFIAAILFSARSFSQDLKDAKIIGFTPKKDTVISVTLKLDDFKRLLYVIDANIDSKKASGEIIQFLQQNARIVEADKPKEQPKTDKPKN